MKIKSKVVKRGNSYAFTCPMEWIKTKILKENQEVNITIRKIRKKTKK